MPATASMTAVETPHGSYRVEGLDRFPVAGDLVAAVADAVAAHVAAHGAPPALVQWDDLVLDYRADRQALRLLRVTLPVDDPWLDAQLDGAARRAVRVEAAGTRGAAHAHPLFRLVGWADEAPATPRLFAPSRRAASISVVINYRNGSAHTLPCLAALARQARTAPLQIILVDNRSSGWERAVVVAGADQLFGAADDVTVTHLGFDAPFNHSAQCNLAAGTATGEVLVMMSNDCGLIDPDTLQLMADWALEPGVGTVGPLLVEADGRIGAAGMGIGPIRPDEPAPRIHDTGGRYLSNLLRGSDGTSFACAALSRAAWDAVDGLDAERFPLDYNDADLCLRLTALGHRHLHLGTHRARHSAGTVHRTRESGDEDHSRLAAAHDLTALRHRAPLPLPIRITPVFDDPSAATVMDWLRIARRALHRGQEGVAAAEPVAAAMARLAGLPPPVDAAPERLTLWYRDVRAGLQALAAAFLESEPPDGPLDRSRRAVDRLAGAEAALCAARTGSGPSPAAALPGATADADPAFFSHLDERIVGARHRLLVFADTFGPSQRILFLQGLARARAAGLAGVRIVTEQDLLGLRSAGGEAAIGAWLHALFTHVRPTAVIASRFASEPGFTALAAELARWPDVPLVAHLDDDLFGLPAAIGTDRYREARHPRRIHTLRAAAAAADLLIAASPVLAGRLADRFGAARVGLCSMAEAGVPPGPLPAREGPITIGYHGAATHNRDLEMIAPALTRLKARFSDVRLEIVGSVARRPAAAALAGIADLDGGLEADYPTFRRALGERGWDIGLAPLAALPFNAAKTPIKWTEYAENGIAVLASRTEPYLSLGAAGAALLASPHEWEKRLTELVHHPERRQALRLAAARLVGRYRGWDGLEARLLGLLDRAAARRRLADAA